MNMYGGHGYGAWLGGGFVWIILIVVIVIVVVFWVLKSATSSSRSDAGGHDSRAKTPLELLEERFVRGEIDEEEFEHKRKVLERR